MNKEEISMSEFMPTFVKFATEMHEQMNDIQQQISDLRQDMNQRFDYHENWLNRIERNMATKTQLNSLLGVLQRKEVISKYEVNHIQTATNI